MNLPHGRRGFWDSMRPRAGSGGKKSQAPPIVSFTGGIGAQILSLAIVLEHNKSSRPIGVDLSYFEQEPRQASLGEGVSIWPWGLDFLGFPIERVSALSNIQRNEGLLLSDSPQKLAMGVSALVDPGLKGIFPRKEPELNFSALNISDLRGKDRYVALHLRRGDYLNVASHLVPDQAYAALAARLSNVIPNAILISDSTPDVKSEMILRGQFEKFLVIGGLEHNPGEVHHLLRNAAIHVGSNGQFSLTAGLLSEGLYLAPKRFVTGEDDINLFISSLSEFSAVKTH